MLRKFFWLTSIYLCTLVAVQAQTVLTVDQLHNEQSVELDQLNWKYSPDDEPRFADPQFDDRPWETLNGTALAPDRIPQSGWRGLGWFRLRLKVDLALTNQPLALVLAQFGASEVYLNGKLIARYGTVGATPESEVEYNPNTVPLSVVLDGRGEHVIAVRHSCMVMRDLTSWRSRWLHRLAGQQLLRNYTNRTIDYGAGFGLKLQELNQAQAIVDRLRSPDGRGFALYASGLALVIGLLHLLMYWFYRDQRANLFFGLFACLVFVTFASQYAMNIGHYGASGILWLSAVNSLSFHLFLLSLLAFFYTVFFQRLPRWFWLWFVAAGLFFFMAQANLLQTGYRSFIGLAFVEALRVVIQSIRKSADGAGVLGIGMLLCAIMLLVLGTYQSTGTVAPLILRVMAVFSLVLPPSIFMARRFARMNLDLEAQLAQVKQLSAEALEHEKVKAENDRRAAELEEARQLQFSLLPKKLPNLPHLDLAAYMRTASEVGGDYYDFHLTADGTLTIAVGDATGHGLRAGTLVASVKSLFVSLAYHPDIPHIFERISRVLKEMRLRGLFMAMTMVKVKGNQMSVSIAGMPSVLIYRALSGEVEEIVMRALPLGGMTKYQYQQRELALAENDVVVLMSDGLPERFNPAGEMLDYERIFQSLPALARQSSEQIITDLVRLGDEWSEGRPQSDDMTFVVLKYIECGRLAAAFRS
jgi:serine phosphatase RsbU (regulator of sigma subunit)